MHCLHISGRPGIAIQPMAMIVHSSLDTIPNHTSSTVCRSNPEIGSPFHDNMSTYSHGELGWSHPSVHPASRLTDGVCIGDNDVILVDMGGGQGYDISKFRSQWPDIPGQLILQDLPGVIAKQKRRHYILQLSRWSTTSSKSSQ